MSPYSGWSQTLVQIQGEGHRSHGPESIMQGEHHTGGMDAGVTVLGAYNKMRSAGPKAELRGWAWQGVQGSQALQARIRPNSLCWGGDFLKTFDPAVKTNPLVMGSVVY